MPNFPDDHLDPDPAALDELSRAFVDEVESEEGSGTVAPGEHDRDHTPAWLHDEDAHESDAPTGVSDEPADLVIVEQDPLPDPTPAPPPTVIRIDDYSGSTVIAPKASRESEQAEPAIGRDADPVVISIDDDGGPDAVYLQGSLDDDSSRPIVLIEDDDTGDSVRPEQERNLRRGIEPRLRERRVAVKRAAGRRRLKWVALAVGVVVVVVGTLAVLGSPLFAVRAENVVVTGNVYTDPERLGAIVDDLVGTPTLRLDSQGAERDLEAIPWVESARVRAEFPHGVVIEIRERAAMTTYQGPDGRYRVLDREGRVLDVRDNYPFAYLLIGGDDAQNLEAGQFAPVGYAAASELAKILTPTIRGQIAFVDVKADGSQLDLLLDGGTRVKFGEARDLFVKLIRVEAELTSQPIDGIEVIDVSTNEVTR